MAQFDTQHPLRAALEVDYRQMQDTAAGERAVKAAGSLYLPPTAGMIADGLEIVAQAGRWNTAPAKSYFAYLQRAVFRHYVSDTIDTLHGMLHCQPAVISVPDRMAPMVARCGASGESAEAVLQAITRALLHMGRCGGLLDAPTGADASKALPYVALYDAPSILNWDDGEPMDGMQKARMVTLDESAYVRRDGAIDQARVRRVRIAATAAVASVIDSSGMRLSVDPGAYVNGLWSEASDTAEAAWTAPEIAGKTCPEVPFVFCNAGDLFADPGPIPLLGLSNIALSLYRAEADHRQSLHMQGQDTLVIIGATTPPPGGEPAGTSARRIGAGAAIELNARGDAKFIGVSANGLDAQWRAIEEDRKACEAYTARMLEGTGNDYASGRAISLRTGQRSASLKSIAENAARALEELLRMAARWLGEDESKVSVKPNVNFVVDAGATKSVLELTQAKISGMAISQRTIHDYARRMGVTTLTFEEEKAAIESEPPPVIPAPKVAAGAAGAKGGSTGGAPVKRGA